MSKEKSLRKITRILMALVLTICTVFTSVGTMGITEVKAAEGDTLITSLDVNIDMSKLPELIVGTEIGSMAENIPRVPNDVVHINSSNIGTYVNCDWYIKANEEFVTMGYITQKDYEIAAIYNYFVPLWKLPSSYKISENDIYCCCVFTTAATGYTFAENNGEDITDIVKCNRSDILALSCGYEGMEDEVGRSINIYMGMGTPSEIENNKNNSKPSTPENKDYTLENGKLTIKSDNGMMALAKDVVNHTFDGTQVTSVEILDGVALIENKAFSNFTNMTSITMPDSINYIGDNAFEGCTALTSIEMPDNDIYYGEKVFLNTSNLKTVVFKSERLSRIGADMFEGSGIVTPGEKGIKVPAPGLSTYQYHLRAYTDYIESYTFGGYEFDAASGKLTVTSNKGTKYWNSRIAEGGGDVDPDAVVSVEIKEGVTKVMDPAFESCKALTSVSLQNSLKEIEAGAFYDCTSLKTITIPENVTKIDARAFLMSGLERIVIPANVQSIGDRAFYGCSALKEVKAEGTNPASIGSNVFDETNFVTNSQKGIKVPLANLTDYQTAWSDWVDYIAGYKAESGNLNSEATVAEDSPVKGATLTNSKEELLGASGIFTKEEKEQIANGADANVWLELNKADLSKVSEKDQAAILDKAKDYMGEGTELTYFDASLFKKIEGQSAQKVSEPGISMKLTIQIPTDLLPTDKDVDRQYTIIRLHDGQAEEITGTFDETAGTFTFETDKFSTYAIAYKDTAKNNGGNNNGNNGGNNGGNNSGNNNGNNNGSNNGNNGGSNNGNNGGNQNGNTNGNQTLVADNTTNTPSTVDTTNTVANTDTSGTSAETTTATPDTGDNSNVVIWLVVALMGMAVIAAASRKRRA